MVLVWLVSLRCRAEEEGPGVECGASTAMAPVPSSSSRSLQLEEEETDFTKKPLAEFSPSPIGPLFLLKHSSSFGEFY